MLFLNRTSPRRRNCMNSSNEYVLVFDIGKTHVKVSVLDKTGVERYQNRTTNRVLQTTPYYSYDVDGIWNWLKREISSLTPEFNISKISIATHGAAAALINSENGSLLLPVMDYEFEAYPDERLDYEAIRPPVKQTGSPALPAGLNLGRQLHWQSQLLSDEQKKTAILLMYPQYWAWKLSGQFATEITSLGCHTDLWNFEKNEPTSLLKSLGWEGALPPLKQAWMPIGKVKPKLAAELGLSENCQIFPGIHDSNAGYVPILKRPKDERPTVVSTGTWCVIMDGQSDCGTLNTTRDMLVNIDAESAPLATARYMGGREFGLICERLNTDIATTFTDDDLEDIFHSNTFIMPSYCKGTGPFPNSNGQIMFGDNTRWINGKAAATIYSALMVNNILQRLNPSSKQDILIEGSFAANSVLCGLLATLNPDRTVRTQKNGNGVTEGCFLLTQWSSPFQDMSNHKVAPYPSKTFLHYAAEWQSRL